MTAWLVVLSFALGLAVLLLRGRGGERGVQIAVVGTLLAGLIGYAATGRLGIDAARPSVMAIDTTTTAFETERQRRLARFGRSAAWLTFSDALLRADASAMAVRGLRGAIDDAPHDMALWIGLGHALAVHGGEVGAASRLAFDHAATLSPDSPHPVFFLALAQFETGDRAAAAATWRALKTQSLPDPTLDTWLTRATS